MKKYIYIYILSMLFSPSALALGRLQGYVERGGSTVLTNLRGDSIRVQRSCPGATIAVYSGSTGSSLATIYADSSLTPKGSIFTADSFTGFFDFFTNEPTVHIIFDGCGMTWTRVFPISGSTSLYDVTSFGAIADDAIDDSTAFINAVAAAGTTPIYVPKGVFLLNASVALNGGMRCAGQSASEIKVKDSSSFTSVLQNYMFTVSTGTTISDCTINANKANNASKRIGGVHITGSTSNVTISHTTIKNTPFFDDGVGGVYSGDGIYLESSGTNFQFNNITLDGNERCGICMSAGTYIYISDAKVTNSGLFGIDMEPNNITNTLSDVSIVNSTFDTSGYTIYGVGIAIDGMTDGIHYIDRVTIANTTIRNHNQYGLSVSGARYVNVVNSQITNNSKQTSNAVPNVLVGTFTNYVKFSNTSLFGESEQVKYGIDITNNVNTGAVSITGTHLGGIVNDFNDPGTKLTALTSDEGWIVFGKRYTATWDPPSIDACCTSSSHQFTDVTISGVSTADRCIANLSTATSTLMITCNVISGTVARVIAFNPTSGAINPASGTVRVSVWRQP